MSAMSRDVSPIFGRRVACTNDKKGQKRIWYSKRPFFVMKETRFKALAAQWGEHRRTKLRTKNRPLSLKGAWENKLFSAVLPPHKNASVGHGVDAFSVEIKHHFSLWHGPGHSACHSKLKAHIPVAQRSALNFFFLLSSLKVQAANSN